MSKCWHLDGMQNCTEAAGEDIAGRSVGEIDNTRPLGIVARMKAEVLLDERHIMPKTPSWKSQYGAFRARSAAQPTR